jgi:hypothetical protein
MSTVSLLGRADGIESFDSFAEKFFAALDLPLIKQRPFGFDAGQPFYHGRKGLLQFRITASRPDSVFDGQYPYSICISSTALDHDALVEEVQTMMQSVLRRCGFDFKRMVAVGRVDGASGLR